MLASDLDPTRIPSHIACVMDGNGRWAEQRGLPRTDGHTAGEQALFEVLDGADDLGVGWFTVYAFQLRTGAARSTRCSSFSSSTRRSF